MPSVRSRMVCLMRVAAWGYFTFITVFSLVPMPEVVSLNLNDLFLHFLAYGLMVWWFAQSYETVNRVQLMIGCAAWGVLMEVAQGVTPHRTFDTADMVANALGVVLGWGIGRTHRPLLDLLFPNVDYR